MNHRHIQTFLTVSAAFFALNAPLQANACSHSAANATARVAQGTRTDVNATTASKPERQAS